MSAGSPDDLPAAWEPQPLPADDALAAEPDVAAVAEELAVPELAPGPAPTPEPEPAPTPEPEPGPTPEDRAPEPSPSGVDAGEPEGAPALPVAAYLAADPTSSRRRRTSAPKERSFVGLLAAGVVVAASVLFPLQVVAYRSIGPTLVTFTASALVLVTGPGVLRSVGDRGRVSLLPAVALAAGVLGLLGCFVAALIAVNAS